jgi:hypothetical protein
MYKQSGPGVFKGDLTLSCRRGSRAKVGGIDTGARPLYLLTGEYDFSCSPDDIGAHCREKSRGRGDDHRVRGRPFPMS